MQRERGITPSGILSELDGSKARRDLAPIEVAQWVGVGAFGFACMIEAVHKHLRIPRREIVSALGSIAKMGISESYRDRMISEDRQQRLMQLKEYQNIMAESGYTVSDDVIGEIAKLEQKLHTP